MDQHEITAHGDAMARERRAKREVEIVQMEMVERRLVEAQAPRDRSARGDEHAVERLRACDDERTAAADQHDELAALGVGCDDKHVVEWMPRQMPCAADQPRRSRDPDDVVARKMPEQPGGEIRRQDLDIVVRKNERIAARSVDRTVVRLGERACIANRDDLVLDLGKRALVACAGFRELRRLDAAHDDRHRGHCRADRVNARASPAIARRRRGPAKARARARTRRVPRRRCQRPRTRGRS
jgi:hypothetical protein